MHFQERKSAWSSLLSGVEAGSPWEKLAILLFTFTCIQAAFLQPNVTLVPGERAKLFTGLLCGLSLLASVLAAKKPLKYGSLPEVIISIVLCLLIFLSGVTSTDPLSSSFRGFVVAASGAGGFWCARILLRSDARREKFTQFCAIILAVMIALGIFGLILSGDIIQFLDVNKHPIACRMLLLSFAPLTLILRGGRSGTVVGVLLLCLSYPLFLISNLRSAALIPIAMAFLSLIMGTLRPRYFVAILIPLTLILGIFFWSLPREKIGLEYEPAYYRAENIPFSWHIAKKHPFLGIGFRAPREMYLEDYEIKYPFVTKEKFGESVKLIVTSENIFLNFLVDVGLPFLLLYTGSLAVLVFRLIRGSTRTGSEGYFPRLAIFLPITAGLLHFLVLDGLLHPQISWFFHILLGLIPYPGDHRQSEAKALD